MRQANAIISQFKNEVISENKPSQERSRATREKILKGARVILARDGAASLSARRIAQESGLTTGAIYNLFSGMSAILFCLYEARLEQELGTFKDSFGAHTGAVSLEDLLREFMEKDATLQWGSPYDLALREAIQSDPELKNLDRQYRLLQREQIVKALKKHNCNANTTQIRAIATMILDVLESAYNLRHNSGRTDKKFVYKVCCNLIINAMTYIDTDNLGDFNE